MMLINHFLITHYIKYYLRNSLLCHFGQYKNQFKPKIELAIVDHSSIHIKAYKMLWIYLIIFIYVICEDNSEFNAIVIKIVAIQFIIFKHICT